MENNREAGVETAIAASRLDLGGWRRFARLFFARSCTARPVRILQLGMLAAVLGYGIAYAAAPDTPAASPQEARERAQRRISEALGACAVGCFGWAGWRSAGNETSGFLLRSATRGHRPAGGRRMPVDGPAGRADWGRISWFHAAASPGIRLMFSARHTRAHSPRAWSRPRTLKRRKPSACLIQPLGASDSHLRLA